MEPILFFSYISFLRFQIYLKCAVEISFIDNAKWFGSEVSVVWLLMSPLDLLFMYGQSNWNARIDWPLINSAGLNEGISLLSGKIYYQQMLWNHEAAWLGLEIIVSL